MPARAIPEDAHCELYDQARRQGKTFVPKRRFGAPTIGDDSMLNPLKLRKSALPLTLFLGFMTLFGDTAFAADKRTHVDIILPVGSYFTYMSADFEVPKETPPLGTAFIWPGLEPDRGHPGSIGPGVLQPTLSHGPSCQAGDVKGWYVTPTYHIRNDRIEPPAGIAGAQGPGYECPGGASITVDQGELLKSIMSYNSTTQEWNMSIEAPRKDPNTERSVSFNKELSVGDVPQRQVLALLFYEPRNGATLKNKITFTNIVLKATHSAAVTSPVICPKAPAGCSGATSKLENHVETCTIKKCEVN